MRFSLIFLVLFAHGTTFGQSPADLFGLKPGVTTDDEVISAFGKPKEEKADRMPIEIRYSSTQKLDGHLKSFLYERNDPWKKVELWFLDSRLTFLEFWPKNKAIEAAGLLDIFAADFLFVEAFSKDTDLGSFEGQKETTVPKVYPTRYYMLAVKSDQIILALINNGSFKALLKDSAKRPTVKMFPGFVENVMVLPRKAKGN